jgi:hypothetical protein
MVGLAPVLADELAELAEHPPRFPIERRASAAYLGHGVDDLAIYVELGLAGRGVADANRARTPMTLEMREHLLALGKAAVNVVKDRESRASESRAMEKPSCES